MTEAILKRTPDIDFIYYSNDMIGAGGLLYCMEAGLDIPGQIGLAGFNAVELLDGLPRQLATMDACRAEIGQAAARIIADRVAGIKSEPETVTLSPRLTLGDTLQR